MLPTSRNLYILDKYNHTSSSAHSPPSPIAALKGCIETISFSQLCVASKTFDFWRFVWMFCAFHAMPGHATPRRTNNNKNRRRHHHRTWLKCLYPSSFVCHCSVSKPDRPSDQPLSGGFVYLLFLLAAGWQAAALATFFVYCFWCSLGVKSSDCCPHPPTQFNPFTTPSIRLQPCCWEVPLLFFELCDLLLLSKSYELCCYFKRMNERSVGRTNVHFRSLSLLLAIIVRAATTTTVRATTTMFQY